VNDDIIRILRDAVGSDAVLTTAEDRAPFEKGWRYGEGRASCVVLPQDTAGVSTVLRLCARHGLRVQPVGANTGLVAASNPDGTGEQVVLGMQRMDQVVSVDPVDRVAVVQAGVTLSALNETLGAHDLWYPIDLGADPQIGGMIATNTGGTRLVRYGDVRDNLLGVEVVLADGTVVPRGAPLRKNNTGLDLQQLFVGTSGRFGVVTQAALAVAPRPNQRITFLFGLGDGNVALELLQALERELGDFLSAFETISHEALEITVRRGSRVRDPFPGRAFPLVALVELSTSCRAEHLDLTQVVMNSVAGLAAEIQGLDDEAILLEQDDAFWHLRHSLTEALRLEGLVLAFDLSVPRSKLADFSRAIRERVARLQPGAKVCDYGHWGDGGTHVNILLPASVSMTPGSEAWVTLQEAVYALCVEEFGGSYSAEHGVGPHNQHVYDRYVDAQQAAISGKLEEWFDRGTRLGTVRWGPPKA